MLLWFGVCGQYRNGQYFSGSVSSGEKPSGRPSIAEALVQYACAMLKHRLIPVLLLQNGLLVRSELFKIHQVIGNPIHEVKRFNEWTVDELIYLDISQEDHYDNRRDDQKVKRLTDPLEILDEVSKTCFMPLTWGGRIHSLEDMRRRIQHGADKITIN